MHRISLILSLFLPLLFLACSEEKDPVEKPAPEMVRIDPPPPVDTGYNPANEDAFEYTIWREYVELATQVPKRKADSVMRSVTGSNSDPRTMRKRLKEELDRLNALQDTIARFTIHDKYDISYDSIQAILDEVNGKINRGEIER